MSKQYINATTAEVYETPNGKKRSMLLIFGDEVETTGLPKDKLIPVKYRNRAGYIDKNKLGSKPALEIYFIDVGQGDSTFIITPNRKKILIDGGINHRALGFLAWKYRLDLKESPDVDIDLLVLSHADADHLEGLIPIVGHPKIIVKKVIHSGIATFKSDVYKTELGNLNENGEYLITYIKQLSDLTNLKLSKNFSAWQKVLTNENVPYQAVSALDKTFDISDPDITIDIINPILKSPNNPPALQWFKDKSHTINGHSVVLRLNYNKVSVLLTGDINKQSSEIMLADPILKTKLSAHVLKTPHHGSQDFADDFLKAVRPQISVISSGDEGKYGHPRAIFIGSVGKDSRSDSPLVFSTEIAAAFVEEGEKKEKSTSLKGEDFKTVKANAKARKVFKQRLHGMINIRSDGQKLYAFRRIMGSSPWEQYCQTPAI